MRQQVTLNSIAGRHRLVTEPKPAGVAKLAQQTVDCRRRVRDPAVFPNLAADTALRQRNSDPVLVNVKPDIRDKIPHDPSPMQRLCTGQSGATLGTCIL
jgi:hypothetical protein